MQLCKVRRGATHWLPRGMRTQDAARAPFPSLPACPPLSVGVRMWVGSEGRGAFLSHSCPLGRLETWRRLHRESEKDRHARLPGNAGGGPAETPPTHPTAALGPTTAATPLESRRALRSASQRDAKRPPPLIGGPATGAGSGRGRRIQDGGGQEVATVRVDGEGKSAAAASA